ncbi:MAG: LysR family transcriptional regulator [Myxococcales bacterium]|nr:LysR family transcriptional regulator [Myxococcales bacterium]
MAKRGDSAKGAVASVDPLASPSHLPLLAAFVAVVDSGSFTAAARRTGVDKALLSRRVRALEQALELRLLNRTTRTIYVTDVGRALYDRSAPPRAEVFSALEQAAASDKIGGTVPVATAPALSEEVWGPVLVELAWKYPQLEVEPRATETLVSLVEQGFDVAIRMGRLPDSSTVARKLACWRHVLCAAPSWVQAHPEVRSPADLVEHWILYTDVPMASSWRFERGDQGLQVKVASRMRTDNGEVMLAMLRQGMGISALAPFQVADLIARGELVRCLPDWRVGHQHGVYVVLPHASHTSARVEVVAQAVARRVSERELSWRRLGD